VTGIVNGCRGGEVQLSRRRRRIPFPKRPAASRGSCSVAPRSAPIRRCGRTTRPCKEIRHSGNRGGLPKTVTPLGSVPTAQHLAAPFCGRHSPCRAFGRPTATRSARAAAMPPTAQPSPGPGKGASPGLGKIPDATPPHAGLGTNTPSRAHPTRANGSSPGSIRCQSNDERAPISPVRRSLFSCSAPAGNF
jgi:hypothetical protein